MSEDSLRNSYIVASERKMLFCCWNIFLKESMPFFLKEFQNIFNLRRIFLEIFYSLAIIHHLLIKISCYKFKKDH